MPHRRQRHLKPQLLKLMGLSPLVGLLGHRQVGKTTLLEDIAKSYQTFDDSKELALAMRDPASYVKDRAGPFAAIDECQLVPELFPALKEWVRKHPRPGQFLLSGSVRFTSRKAIQESLTGRIVNLELFPMLISELNSQSLPDFWRKIVVSETAPKMVETFDIASKHKGILKYFEQGGLPGVCFIRDATFRTRKLDSQIETLLDRDLRKIADTNIPYPQVLILLQAIADRQGEPFTWKELQQESQISIPTIKKLAYGFENVFILRSLLLEGDVKGTIYFFEDMAELSYLRTKQLSLQQQIIHFLAIHIRGELSYSSAAPFRLFQYRTRAGVCVPLCLQVQRDFIGIIPIVGDEPSRSESAAADSFLKRYGRSKAIFVHMGKNIRHIGDRKLLVPLGATV